MGQIQSELINHFGCRWNPLDCPRARKKVITQMDISPSLTSISDPESCLQWCWGRWTWQTNSAHWSSCSVLTVRATATVLEIKMVWGMDTNDNVQLKHQIRFLLVLRFGYILCQCFARVSQLYVLKHNTHHMHVHGSFQSFSTLSISHSFHCLPS